MSGGNIIRSETAAAEGVQSDMFCHRGPPGFSDVTSGTSFQIGLPSYSLASRSRQHH
jgi:hypothetical protein